jgi:hypothetical protein
MAQQDGNGSVLHRENYLWMIAGVVVIVIGFVLMAGGAPTSPDEFRSEEVYGFRRTTLAPIVVIAGFVIEILAIFRRPKPAA